MSYYAEMEDSQWFAEVYEVRQAEKKTSKNLRPSRLPREQEDMLVRACLSLKKNNPERRKALLRMAQRYLQHRPEFAYYLSIGTVPKSINLWNE